MTIPEMYSKIESNEKQIEAMFDPTTFVLVKEAHDLLKENEKLKKECAKLGAPYEKREDA